MASNMDPADLVKCSCPACASRALRTRERGPADDGEDPLEILDENDDYLLWRHTGEPFDVTISSAADPMQGHILWALQVVRRTWWWPFFETEIRE